MVRITKKNSSKRKLLLIAPTAIILLGGLVFLLEKQQIINLYSNDRADSSDEVEAQTTSTAPTAQADFSDGTEREDLSSEKNEGVVTDTQGSAPTPVNDSSWSYSANKALIVYTPSKDSVLKSGDLISGASSTSKVSFRLIDDVSGVIATGELAVKDGKFSGIFDFATTGSKGRLDVFSVGSGGVEQNNVEIPIRFK